MTNTPPSCSAGWSRQHAHADSWCGRSLWRRTVPRTCQGTRGYRHLTGEFVTHLIRRARDEKLVYLAVHNHGGTDTVSFSRTDLQSHERGYPTLLGLTRCRLEHWS